MQQVLKVNIGNLPFTLEQEAYAKMEAYQQELFVHYEDNQNRDEILGGIEERVAELLVEKGYKDRVVTAEVIDAIISVLGRPDEMDGESGESKHRQPKRLMRDVENKKLGGVCAGLGAYFAVDPVIFRLIFVFWVFVVFWFELFLANSIHISLVGFVVYVALWIAIPAAKTVEDKCRMRNGSMSFKDVQRNVEQAASTIGSNVEAAATKVKGSDFIHSTGRALGIFFGVLLFIIGISGSLATALFFLGVGAFSTILPAGSALLVSIFSSVPSWVVTAATVLVAVAVALPFIMLLYEGVLLLFRLHSPKWRPGLIMLLLWIVSLLGLAFLSFTYLAHIRDVDAKIYPKEDFAPSDTVYVEFAGSDALKHEKALIEADRNSYFALYMLSEGRDVSFVIYPELHIRRSDSNGMSVSGNADFIADSENITVADMFTDGSEAFWRMEGNTLYVEPIVFSRNRVAKELYRNLNLTVGEDVVVIVKNPVYHAFDRSFDFCNDKFLRLFD